jgi:hypothetical protein
LAAQGAKRKLMVEKESMGKVVKYGINVETEVDCDDKRN